MTIVKIMSWTRTFRKEKVEKLSAKKNERMRLRWKIDVKWLQKLTSDITLWAFPVKTVLWGGNMPIPQSIKKYGNFFIT